MLLLKRQSETIDNRPQDLKQLGNPVEALGLVRELEEDVVDGSTNIRTQVEEFAVDPMQGSLQEIPLPGIFRVKKLQ